MSLAAGNRLGPYEIQSAIGAGGMGEVYRARDTRLDRTVAIKILPPHVAGDPEFRERFEREARAVSQLNHPHICTLHDVGRLRADGATAGEGETVDFLVLEYLDGESLADRLRKGPLPVDQAIAYATQIAAALDAAHRRGILHRDLKPGNVMVTASGVKLLDFGLAKTTPASAGAGSGRGTSFSAPVTMTTPLTSQGTILGTFQYMAPEVIEGEAADARADIWAFGCVLHEMLTGVRPFAGKTQASLIGAILKDEPPSVSAAQPLVPPALDRIVRTCLAKDPNQRVQSAHDLLLNLQWIAEGGSAAGVPAPVLARRRSRERTIWLAAAIAAALFGALAAWLLKPAPPRTNLVRRFVHTLPADQSFTRTGRHAVAIAPDGSFFIYVANSQLYLRRMNELEAQPIKGTQEDPVEPVISPDGQWVAYCVPPVQGAAAPTTGQPSAALKKIPVTGGAPIILATVGFPFGAAWQGDTIVVGQGPGGVVTVPHGGGTPTNIVTLRSADEVASMPQLVDAGRTLVFTLANRGLSSWNEADVVAQSLPTGERTVIVTGAHDAHVLPGGILTYVRAGTLFAGRFDPARPGRVADAAPLVTGITAATAVGSAGPGQYAISTDGHLTYLADPGQAQGAKRSLVWVNRDGREEPIVAERRGYVSARVASDGARIALDEGQGLTRSIWIWDVQHDILQRLTSELDQSEKRAPVWLPGSRSLIYSATGNGRSVVIRVAADGTGTPEELVEDKQALLVPKSMSRDGQQLLYTRWTATTSADIASVPISGDRTPRPLIATPAIEDNPTVSPDGRWLSYESQESGRTEIYVRTFPDVNGARWQISANGGRHPVWSRDGRELFFETAEGRLAAIRVDPGETFRYAKPTLLFDVKPYFVNFPTTPYDVAPDGRFVFIKDAPTQNAPQTIVFVGHWLDEVRARVMKR